MEPASASEARRFGKYTLVAKLATGGMAEIFLARLHGDGGFEKLVCIKRILPHLAKDPQFVAMFLDEARVAARISHPNVCQVFELGEWKGQYYIAMEYLEGVPLSVFRRHDFYPMPPDPRLVAGVGVQACEGLHHAHLLKRPDGELLGVVHRDISPSNLFATTDGIVKVLDFGIAKVQDASVRTSTGAVKGTYAYMAPEQLRNDNIDRRVDVWAIGTVLWETLAQRHLFKRDTEFLTFEAITKDPIPDICEVRPDVPALLGDVIARALSRNPADRFASARSLGEALAQAVGPLGGPLNTAALSDEVSHAFEATLAEQRMLLRIAREGGQFDLDSTSPLVGHGTRLTATPTSAIQRRAQDAQQEVAHYVAATAAIDSLVDDEALDIERPLRPGTDGSFTPAPSRRTSQSHTIEQEESGILIAPAPARRSGQQPYAVAPREWRYDETSPPAPATVEPGSRAAAAPPIRPSRLPWIIALISISAAAATGAMLYLKLSEKKAAKEEATSETTISMTPTPTTPPSATPEPVAAAGSAQEEEKTGSGSASIITRLEVPDESDDAKDAKAEKRKKRREREKAEKAEKAEKTVAKVETPSAGPPGFITIDSTPVYAVIFINGKKYGETPLVNIKLPPGRHAVRAVSPSGSTRNLSLTIEPGKTAPVKRIEW